MVSRRFVLLIIIVAVRKFISFNPQLFIPSNVTNKCYGRCISTVAFRLYPCFSNSSIHINFLFSLFSPQGCKRKCPRTLKPSTLIRCFQSVSQSVMFNFELFINLVNPTFACALVLVFLVVVVPLLYLLNF